MPAYRMVYGDDEQVVRETFHDVQVEREDGWTVLFRGQNAILRVRDEHVQSLELLDAPAPAETEPGEARLTVGADALPHQPSAPGRRAVTPGHADPR